jgi:hypothetical protein
MSIEENIYAIFSHSTNNTIQRITNLISADTADTTKVHPMTTPINHIFSESSDHFTTRNIDGNNDDNVSIIQCIHRINQLINDSIDENTPILIPFRVIDNIITNIGHNEQEPRLFIYKLLQNFYLAILDIWINKLNSQTPNGNTANMLELLRRDKKKMESGYYVDYYRHLIYKRGKKPSPKHSSVASKCNRLFQKRSRDRVQKEKEFKDKKRRTMTRKGYSDSDDESNVCSGSGCDQSTSSVTYGTLEEQYSYDTWGNYDSDNSSSAVSSEEENIDYKDEDSKDEYKEEYGNYPDKNEFKFS